MIKVVKKKYKQVFTIGVWFCCSLFPVSAENVIAYPNPFDYTSNQITFRYNLISNGLVSISVYSMQGQLVKTLFERSQQAGSGSPVTTTWDVRNQNGQKLSSGIYVVYLQVEYLNPAASGSAGYESKFRFTVLR